MREQTTRLRGPWRAIALAVLLAATLGGGPAAAAEHDLVMYGLNVDPNPLERGCSATLHASFLIDGSEDYTLSSGAAEIQFYWADGANPVPTSPSGWNPAGTLTVTWSSSDGPFAEGREWPTDFPSVAGTGGSWSVPESGTSFHLRAVVEYTGASGVTDALPVDNELVATDVPSVAGSCSSIQPCIVGASGIILCPPWKYRVPELRCLLDPDCFRIHRPICSVVPCPLCLSCPPEGWEIFVDLPVERIRLEIVDARGEVVARSEPFRTELPRSDFKVRQVLRFQAKEGVDYGLRMLAGPEVDPGEELRFDLEMRAAGKAGY